MSTKAEFDSKYNIIDAPTPSNAQMSGQYKRSHAYNVLQSQLPVVLTNVIDTLTKDKQELTTQFGESSREELKIIIGLISRLKYELQTDKPFELFKGDEPDAEQWNQFLKDLPEDKRSFFKGYCLHAECYTYRALQSFLQNSESLRDFDFFAKVKRESTNSSLKDIVSLTHRTRRLEKTFDDFGDLLKLNLSSNRNDRAMVKASNISLQIDELVEENDDDDEETSPHVLVDNSEELWAYLSDSNRMKSKVIDIICDDAGFELFNDFVLAEYLIEHDFANKVRFHVKAYPWFISDATDKDFNWTLNWLSEHKDYATNLIGKKYLQFLEDGKFELAPISYFWTSPYAFSSMKGFAPELYTSLKKSRLIIFKGDLNYRKLLGDICWDSTHNFKDCLKGFLPTNICVISTINGEFICGLSKEDLKDIESKDPDWKTKNYGIIQFVNADNEFGF